MTSSRPRSTAIASGVRSEESYVETGKEDGEGESCAAIQTQSTSPSPSADLDSGVDVDPKLEKKANILRVGLSYGLVKVGHAAPWKKKGWVSTRRKRR